VVAAKNGHLEVLKYYARNNAHDNGCEWDKQTCAQAAGNGHLEVLKYAHENGREWGKWTCSNAAINGHLEVLKYFVSPSGAKLRSMRPAGRS
jgi:hypothetical protein